MIEAWFTFETASAWGRHPPPQGRQCRTLLTAMTDLKGHEESAATRPLGVRHKADRDRETWAEAQARDEAALGDSEQPYCLSSAAARAASCSARG